MLLSNVCRLSLCLSRTAGITREQRGLERPRSAHTGCPRQMWLGHHFQSQKVKGQGHQAGLLTPAFTYRQLQRSAWERIVSEKLLLRCRLQARRSARRREGGAHRVATHTAYIV